MKVAVLSNEKELEIVNKSKAYFVSKLKPLNENMKIYKSYLNKGEDYFYYAYLLKSINQYYITDIELSSDEYFINDDDVCELTETKEKEIANKYYNIVNHYEKKSFVEFSTKEEMMLGKYLYTTSGYDNKMHKNLYVSEFLVFHNLEEIYFSDMEFIVKSENGYYVPYYNYDLYLNEKFQIISCEENDTISHIRLEKYLKRKINVFDDLDNIMLCKSEFMSNMIEQFKINQLQTALESCYKTENDNLLYNKSLYKKDGTHIRKCSESEVLYLSKKLTKINVPDINFETPIDFIYIDTVETNDNSNYVSGKSCNGGCYSLCENRHYFGRIKNNNLEIICLEENTSSAEFRMDYRGHYNNDVDVCEFVDADYSIYCSDNRTEASILQYADKCTIDDYLNDQDCEITSQFDENGCFCKESEELYSNDLDNKKEKLKKIFPILIID